jgi:hypothetical protein
LFEVVEQHPLQLESPTFVVQQTNLFSQFIIVVIPMPLAMAIVVVNVLRIPLPKFHDGDDAIIHIKRLTKVCVMNGEDTDAHKLQLTFLQCHYEEKVRIGLFVMRHQISL